MAAQTIVAIMFGGRSTEHEISCRSASYLFRHIDWQKYQVAALAVSKNGKILPQNAERIRTENAEIVRIDPEEAPDPLSMRVAAHITGFQSTTSGQESRSQVSSALGDVIVFSIMHGTYGEDGCWQGCFELANVAYVGPDLIGAAVSMDKVIAKQLVAYQNIPIVDYVAFTFEQWDMDSERYLQEVRQQLGAHVFVKPARLGSSVGITEVNSDQDLVKAILLAFEYDDKVLIERAMNVREIEFAALGGYVPEISLPGEVAAADKFYSYESKYIDPDAAKVLIPAPLTASQIDLGREIAKNVYQALSLHGMARIDLFFDEAEHHFYFNEANTLPGFTSISQYPMLWQHMGLTPTELIERLLQNGLRRWQRASSLKRSFL